MPVTCHYCHKSFSRQHNLNRHLRNVHDKEESSIISYEFDAHKNKCLEGCSSSFINIQQLRKHLQVKHNFEFNEENLQFKTVEEFNTWFDKLLSNNNVQYTHKSTRRDICSETWYYYCNRTGKYQSTVSDTSRKRKLKRQGSCKLNMACTSTIILNKYSNEPNNCIVTFCRTHYGHSMEPQHIRLCSKDRMAIVEKLSSGVTPSRILDSKRQHMQEDALKRDLITLHDILNIKKSYPIDVNDKVGLMNNPISVINQRHTTATKSSFSVEYHNHNKTWAVTNKDYTYFVSQHQMQSSCCQLKCSMCDICIHAYKCTCTDSVIKATICKHIHYVVIKQEHLENTNKQNAKCYLNTEDCNLHAIDEELKAGLVVPASTIKDESIQNLLKEKCAKMAQLDFNNISDSTASYAMKTLTTLHNLIIKETDRCRKPYEESSIKYEPPN